MKECTICYSCFPDHINYCPFDGRENIQSLIGDPILDGRYQLERRLGHGGMGIVYKAHHVFLKTAHAIKVILPELVGNDPTLATRFRQEAMAAAAIRHPNIISVTDYGVIKGLMPFLVMEFVQGQSLHEFLEKEGKLSPQRALEFMVAIASGVNAAHQHGIVHRDLKPLNIMLQDNKPLAEAVKILDFGLAKIKSGELLGSFVLAQTKGVMGSPHYMAPEQWSDGELDQRSDIYSLGILLFQMLAGDVPFKGMSMPTIMKKHLMDPPPHFAVLDVDVPPAIEQVVHHALEKDPDKRPATTEEFISELHQAVIMSATTDPALVVESSADVERITQLLTAKRRAKELPGLEETRSNEDEAARQRQEEEARQRAEEQARQQAEAEKAAAEQRRSEEEQRRAEAARRQAEEEAARLRAEEKRRRQAELEQLRLEEKARQRAEAEAAQKRAEEEARRAAEEARRKAEEEERLRAEEEARQRAEEERRQQEEAAHLAAEAEAQRQAEEEARERAEEEAKRRAAEEELKRAEEEAAAAAEAARQRAAAERRRREEEQRQAEAARQRQEEEARQRAEEQARQQAEAEKAAAEQRRSEEEQRRAEAARRQAEEEAARLRAEEEARLKAEEDVRQLAALEEEKRQAEEAARLKAEEEKRLQMEAEAQRKAEEEAERIRVAEERRRVKAEATRKREEEEARRKAEEEERLRAEALHRQAEAERRRQEEEARQRAEEETRRATEEAARQHAAEEARRQAEETRFAVTVASDATIEPASSHQPIEETQRYEWSKQKTTSSESDAKTMPDSLEQTRLDGIVNLSPPAMQPMDATQQSPSNTISQKTASTLPEAHEQGQQFVPPAQTSASSHDLPAQIKSFPRIYIGAALLLLLLGSAGLYFLTRRATDSKPPQSPQQQSPQTNVTGARAKPGGGATGTSTVPEREMAFIAEGRFQMGRNDGPVEEKPAHTVNVKSFYIDKTEVTNAQYAEFVQATGYPAPSAKEEPYWKPWVGDKPPAGQEQWPVRNVSVADAETYARWLSKRDGVTYRLPTEEEWEYVARDGSSSKFYPWGNQWVDGYANIGSSLPKPVGSYKQGATSTGVLDLIGNVWEWTSSKLAGYQGRRDNIPQDQQGQAVKRGGSYQSKLGDGITATSRDWWPETGKHPTIGFRLVRESP